jgi:hypothetical protein
VNTTILVDFLAHKQECLISLELFNGKISEPLIPQAEHGKTAAGRPLCRGLGVIPHYPLRAYIAALLIMEREGWLLDLAASSSCSLDRDLLFCAPRQASRRAGGSLDTYPCILFIALTVHEGVRR